MNISLPMNESNQIAVSGAEQPAQLVYVLLLDD